ncbi:MAG: spermidine synthase [Candidatus Berkiella sp.]
MFQILIGGGIFISALLLFFIQLLLAKHMLPQFGGSAFVWVTSMLFFQAGLLVGYLYAYLLAKLSSLRLQAGIHFALLLVSLYFLPIHLDSFVIDNQQWPPLSVWLVLSSISLIPFIVISASSPLLQHWFCHVEESEFPYYFYSISNAGSLLGLIGYPFIFEQYLGLKWQAHVFSILYWIYCFLCLMCMLKVVTTKRMVERKEPIHDVTIAKASQWLFLSFLSCALLLAITQFLIQNVINLPLMWAIPLGLYLISFIFTFANAKGYDRNFWLSFFLIFLALTSWLMYMLSMNGYDVVFILLGLLYSACMICHGELVLRKPSQRALTTFYLLIALGGVLGSLFVNIVAYVLLGKWWDFYIPLTLITVLTLSLMYRQIKTNQFTWEAKVLASVCVVMVVVLVTLNEFQPKLPILVEKRSLYGFVRIFDHPVTKNNLHFREIRNGQTSHGIQVLDPGKRNITTSYYGEGTGVYLAIQYLHQQRKRPLNIAVIGLGCGTLASTGVKGDTFDFYELDENVEYFANHYFTFLKDSPAKTKVILGDARLSLVKARFLPEFKPYDLIVADAFNGDSIPFHLLTQEAIALYRSLLSPDGLIALHTSNTYLNFMPLTKQLAKDQHLKHYWIDSPGKLEKAVFAANWAILSADPDFEIWLKKQSGFVLKEPKRQITVNWTDDYNSVLPLLRFRGL